MLTFKKGLTLIEMLAIVGILAVLSAIAHTQYRKYIRQGRQLEAKANLGVFYQKQMSYLSSELRLSPSLKTIGAVPRGRLRYNIGTDWSTNSNEARLNQNNTATDLCPCHNDENNKNIPSHSCWADPNPELITDSCSDTNKCYGDGSDMATQLGSLSNIPSGGFSTEGGVFEYYAIGCTHPGGIAPSQLDIWSINHKKSLQNIRSGLGL